MPNVALETTAISGTQLTPSRIALATWAIGGWMWGGSDDQESIRTIQTAIDRGITIIDTAPVYGFGHAEELVGKALAESVQWQNILIAAKVCLDWRDGEPFRNGSKARIQKEIEDSLRRLQTHVIDLYQFIGRIRARLSERRHRRLQSCIGQARSGRSVSVTSVQHRWIYPEPSRRCTPCNRRIIYSSAKPRRTCCLLP